MPDLLDHAINGWNRTMRSWWLNRVYHAGFFLVWLYLGTKMVNEFTVILCFVIASIHLIALSNTFRPRENT